jgi:uncharacterized protein YbjT (DUF2867 family)
MESRPVLVTGASGYVGGRLVPLLLEAGYRVRASARNPERLRPMPWSGHAHVEITAMDALDSGTVDRAVQGCGTVVYLIHSMIASKGRFADADRTAAESLAAAASAAGVGRIIYLGGLGDTDHPGLSKHLRSRHEVEEIFKRSGVPVTILRAAMIIGSGSASFEILRYLVERLPVMITPKWVSTPCQPIAISDVLGYIKGCIETPETAGKTFDIGGPEVLSYRDLIRIYAQEAGLMPRLIIPVPVLTPTLSSLWIHLVTPVPAVIARPLAEGLGIPVVCRDDAIRTLVPRRLQESRETIRRALERVQQAQADACQLPAGDVMPAEWTYCGDAPYAGGSTLTLRCRILVAAAARDIWPVVEAIGGDGGYYHGGLLWRLRGWLDRLAGGPGLTAQRRHPHRLEEGDYFHFWRVSTVDRPRKLVLQSRMRAPGDALMTLSLKEAARGTEIVLRSDFLSRGLAGLAYWYGLYPAHQWVFRGLLKGIADRCGTRVIEGPEGWPP